MKGLIFRDLLIYFRRMNKSSYITEAVMFIFFLGISARTPAIGLSAYILLCMPLQMSAMPMAMKDMDSNYSGAILTRLMPFSSGEVVGARFLAAFCVQGIYLAYMVPFCIIHSFIAGGQGVFDYLLLILAGLIIGAFLTSMNLLAGFLGNINVSSMVYVLMVVAVAVIYIVSVALKINMADLVARPSVLWICGACAAGALIFVSYKVSLMAYRRTFFR